MADTNFKGGRLVWQTETIDSDTIRSRYLTGQSWSDGFIAFSATEQRLAEAGIEKLSSWLDGRSDANGGPEGYLMEAGLWRTAAANFEELALEREGDRFVVQHWLLNTATDAADGMACYYRPAKTFTRGNAKPFSGAVDSFEVVVPEHRLRFYLTKGV
jgi:hypothetical protein